MTTIVYCIVSAAVAAFVGYHLGYHRGVMYMMRIHYEQAETAWQQWRKDAFDRAANEPVMDADRDALKARVDDMLKDGNLKAPYKWRQN